MASERPLLRGHEAGRSHSLEMSFPQMAHPYEGEKTPAVGGSCGGGIRLAAREPSEQASHRQSGDKACASWHRAPRGDATALRTLLSVKNTSNLIVRKQQIVGGSGKFLAQTPENRQSSNMPKRQGKVLDAKGDEETCQENATCDPPWSLDLFPAPCPSSPLKNKKKSQL